MKYIIDTDPGIDDAIAICLGYLNKLDIIGFTIATGNVSLENTENNLKVIQSVLDSKIEMYRPAILNNSTMYADFAHGKDGLGDINIPRVNMEINTKAAEDFIIEAANKYQDDLTIICLAPLTNLANAIKKDSSFVNKVHEVVIMGGSYDENETVRYKEFNLKIDAESTNLVLNSNFKKIKLVTHEVGVNSYIPLEDILSFKNSKDVITNFIYLVSQKYIEFTIERNGLIGLSNPDPSTIASIIDSSITTFKPCTVKKEEDDFIFTLTDKSNIEVSVDTNVNKFRKLFINTLKR